MRPELLSLYAGPDQLMGFTSVLAGLLGILLIIRNKIVALYFRITGLFRRPAEPATIQQRTPTENS